MKTKLTFEEREVRNPEHNPNILDFLKGDEEHEALDNGHADNAFALSPELFERKQDDFEDFENLVDQS